MTNFEYLDEELFHMAHRIARHGFTTMSVNTGECTVPGCSCPQSPGPTWTYSIGLLEHNHPEIVIVGTPAARAYELIDAAFEWHHCDRPLPSGRDALISAFGTSITTVPVPDRCWIESDLMAFWHNYYRAGNWPPLDGVDNAVVQLVVADAAGRFPWIAGYDDPPGGQPIIEDDDSSWPRWNRETRRARQRQRRRKGHRS